MSGEIIATSHDRFPPNGGDCKGNPRLFQGNLGRWNIMNHLARIMWKLHRTLTAMAPTPGFAAFSFTLVGTCGWRHFSCAVWGRLRDHLETGSTNWVDWKTRWFFCMVIIQSMLYFSKCDIKDMPSAMEKSNIFDILFMVGWLWDDPRSLPRS